MFLCSNYCLCLVSQLQELRRLQIMDCKLKSALVDLDFERSQKAALTERISVLGENNFPHNHPSPRQLPSKC